MVHLSRLGVKKSNKKWRENRFMLYCLTLESRIKENSIIPKRPGLHDFNFVNLSRLGIK